MRVLKLAGEHVASIMLNGVIGVCFANESELLIQSDLFVTLPNGRVSVVSGRTEEALKPVLYLMNRMVMCAVGSEEGDLDVAFDEGVRLRVFADPVGVAWTFVVRNGSAIRSAPGGMEIGGR